MSGMVTGLYQLTDNNTHQYLATSTDFDLVPYDFGPDINSEEDPIVDTLYDSDDD
jgi:hypothetical protein